MDAEEAMDENLDCNPWLRLHVPDRAAIFLANSVRCFQRFPASPGFSAWFFLDKLTDSDARGDDAFNGIRCPGTPDQNTGQICILQASATFCQTEYPASEISHL